MSGRWRELQDELNAQDPGRVARVDQLAEATRRRYDSLRWRLVRAWDLIRRRHGSA